VQEELTTQINSPYEKLISIVASSQEQRHDQRRKLNFLTRKT
jgi:hypothetical protein